MGWSSTGGVLLADLAIIIFLLEARFDQSVLTTQVMLEAARSLPQLDPGAYVLTEIPLSAMWGERAE